MNNPDNIFGAITESTAAELARRLELGIGEGLLSMEPGGKKPALNIFGRRPWPRRGANLSFLSGMAAAGLRTAACLAGSQLTANHLQLSEMARQKLAALVHYTPYPQDGKGRSSGLGGFYDAAGTGLFQLLAANLQEYADFTIIGHKIAELALLPGICAIEDAYSRQQAEVPDAVALRSFLGEPDAHIPCPSPAQRLLFGKSRRRIPQWYNLDTPAMNGTRKEQLGLHLESMAGERYFYHHLPEVIRQVMDDYARLSGRRYAAVKTAEAERADYLLIASGAAFDIALEAARQARNQEKVKVGVAGLSLLNPFPREELAEWLAGKKGVTVLEEAGGFGGEGTVFRELKALAGDLGKKSPALYSGTYAGPLSPSLAMAAIQNMQRKGAQRQRLFLGFDFTRSDTGFPQHELLLQSIRREYPGIEAETTGAPDTKSAVEKNKRIIRSLPFAIRRYQDQGPPYSRLSRFYHNTACFYQQGVRVELVADPFQSLPVVPAATANFATSAEGPAQLPVFQPQQCTGCGDCMTYCPHSALPSIAVSLQGLIRSGMKMAAEQGTPIPQLMGIERKLVKVADGLLREKGGDIGRISDFLPSAFETMVEQSKMEGEKLERAQEGIRILNEIIGDFPVAVTEAFFHQKKRQEKGTAQLFSIAVDPHACTGCNLCADVCQEGALEMKPSEPGLVRRQEATLGLWEQLPDTPADTIHQLIREPEYNPVAATLLSRHFYHSLSGGATSEAGAPAKTVVHWLAALLESAMQPRIEEQAKALEEQVEALAKNIHQHLSNALPKRDFHLSEDALAEFGEGQLSLEDTIRGLDASPQSQLVDAPALRRKIGLLNDLKALLWALREGPTGGGRARYGVLLTGRAAFPWADDYPFNAFTAPVLWQWDGSAPERLLGMLKGQARHLLDHIRLLRRAALEAKNKYRPEVHDEEVGTLEWAGLSAAERELLPPMLLMSDAQLFSGPARQALMELLASGLPVKVVVIDDGAVPAGEEAVAALATAQSAWLSAVSLQHILLVKGSLADNPALFDPLREGLQKGEPAIFQLLAPRPEQHRREKVFWPELSRLALQTRAFPGLLFSPDGEKEYLAAAFNLDQNSKPEHDWIKTTLHYHEGGEEREQAYTLTYGDWLFSLKAWQPYFHPLQPGSGTPTPLAAYLSLDERGQRGKAPVVAAVNEEGQLVQYVAAPEVVAATRQALRQWDSLRELAGLRSPFPQQEREAMEKELSGKYEKEIAELKAAYEARLQEQEQALMDQVRVKLRDKLLALSRKGRPLKPLQEELD